MNQTKDFVLTIPQAKAWRDELLALRDKPLDMTQLESYLRFMMGESAGRTLAFLDEFLESADESLADTITLTVEPFEFK